MAINTTVAQAERLGLATEGLNRHFAQAAADIVAARDRQYLSTGQGIYVRQLAAMGDQRGSQLLAFDRRRSSSARPWPMSCGSKGPQARPTLSSSACWRTRSGGSGRTSPSRAPRSC
ncbi:hypothetical protein [Teichococcus aestuarii]|uniref:hypothetical protein n=1 Tax=Teichococcus aestuarii TaxID=568898 RepID=UPI003618F1C4